MKTKIYCLRWIVILSIWGQINLSDLFAQSEKQEVRLEVWETLKDERMKKRYDLSDKQIESWRRLRSDFPEKTRITWDVQTKNPKEIMGLLNLKADRIDSSNAMAESKAFILKYVDLFDIGESELYWREDYIPRLVNGRFYVGCVQRYKGVPVFGANIKFTVWQNGGVGPISSRIFPNVKISVNPKINFETATNLAKQKFLSPTNVGFWVSAERSLVIYSHPEKNTFYLCWKFKVGASRPMFHKSVTIDAHSGEFLRIVDQVAY